jgi:hypothetical protein
MALLCVPLPLIFALLPVLWGFAAGTPAATAGLYHLGLLNKDGAAERLSAAAADAAQSQPYRGWALREISSVLPGPDPAARVALTNLRKILSDRNPATSALRPAASDLLLKISPETAAETLTVQLASPDANLRRTAAMRLRDMGAAAGNVVASLKTAMDDSDSNVREAAADALSKIAPEELVLKLIANLQNQDGQLRKRAAVSLGNIGPPARAAVPTLERAAKDSDPGVREAVTVALRAVDPKGHPAPRVPTPTRSYSARNTGTTYHEQLPEGTYRVPLSESIGLSSDRMSIQLERNKANALAREVNSLGSDVESERSRYNSLVNEVNSLGSQINLDRQYLDRTSQFAVDNFNYKVRNYNSSMEQARDQQRRYNAAVDAYNDKLREFKSQQQRINDLIDEYNRKLERVGHR